jgi:hypothetical protein
VWAVSARESLSEKSERKKNEKKQNEAFEVFELMCFLIELNCLLLGSLFELGHLGLKCVDFGFDIAANAFHSVKGSGRLLKLLFKIEHFFLSVVKSEESEKKQTQKKQKPGFSVVGFLLLCFD